MVTSLKRAKKAIESLYTGSCDVIERQKFLKDNKATDFREVKIYENIPCRISFKNTTTTNLNAIGVSLKDQEVIMYISPEIKINAGSKIIVTQNNVTTEYSKSAYTAMYFTHQEIALKLFERYS